MFLKVWNTQVNYKIKTSRKTNLGSLVISGQYILKDMKRFTGNSNAWTEKDDGLHLKAELVQTK